MRKPRSGRRIEGLDIGQDAAARKHQRVQGLLDFLYKKIIPPLVVVLLGGFVFWYGMLLGHDVWTQDWVNFERHGKEALLVIFPYVLGFLTQHGVLPKDQIL